MISVAIPTLDRPDDLRRCLESVLGGAEMPAEVLVVDQSSDDSSRAVVESLGSPLVRHIRHSPPSQCGARNRAASEARGEYVAFIDDDVVAPPLWIATMRDELERLDHPDALYGESVNPPDADADGLVREMRFDAPTAWRLPVHPSRIGCGAHMIVRREACDRVGGFDERLGPGSRLFCADELDFNYRLLKQGHRVVSTPALSVVHHRRSWQSADELFRQSYRYSIGNAAFMTKYLRRGDLFAAYMLLRQAASDAKMLVQGLRGRSRLHARVAIHRARGTVAGIVKGWRTFGSGR